MVSTRGPKFKFSDGEKVLCYEPDPTKAKVLYDSKVLDVIVNKDQRGRKAVEYLIHFQGWNSSWDRCVTEEYVLKDTEENRQLQRDLAQKAQLQLGAYLYRRERKKRSHKYSDRSTETETEAKRRTQSSGSRTTSATTGSSEDGSSGQHEDYDTEDIVSEEEMDSSSEFDEETSGDDSGGGSQSGASVRPGVDLEIGPTLKRLLEQDYHLIVNKNKLAVLPAQPTVINVLESWVQHYTTTQLTNIPDKPQRTKVQNSLDKTITDINICRETADGLRIYFDYTLGGLLLYKQEKEQYSAMKEMSVAAKVEECSIKEEIIDSDIIIKEEVDDPEFAHLPPFREQESEKDAEKTATPTLTNTRRKLRSCRLSSAEEPKPPRPVEEIKQETGNLSSMNSLASTSSRCSSPRGVTLRMSVPVINSAQINSLLEDSNKWRLIPESEIKASPLKPSMIYGAIHLARLFVKLPELLQSTDITEQKMKVLLKYIDMFLSYLEMHREWFGEQFYMQRTCSSEESVANS